VTGNQNQQGKDKQKDMDGDAGKQDRSRVEKGGQSNGRRSENQQQAGQSGSQKMSERMGDGSKSR
jgi:hypothetical protein